MRKDLVTLKPNKIVVPDTDILMSLNESFQNPLELLGNEFFERLMRFPVNRYKNKITEMLIGELCSYIDNNMPPESVIMANGADECLYYFFVALRDRGDDAVLTLRPSYFDYKTYSAAVGLGCRFVDLDSDFGFDELEFIEKLKSKDVKAAILCNPNNPTGNLFEKEKLIRIIESTDKPVLIDEAYYEYSGATMADTVKDYPNLIIVRSFSKGFSAAGLRFGYLFGNEKLVYEIKKVMTIFNLSLLTQFIAYYLLVNKEKFRQLNKNICEFRANMYIAMKALGNIEPLKTFTNFIPFKVQGYKDYLHGLLEQNGISVRDISGCLILKDYLRVTIGSEKQNEQFLSILKEFSENV